MLEEKIELLFNTIKERQHQWYTYKNNYGENDILTTIAYENLSGLEEAFQLLSGRSYTSVLLEKMNNNISVVM
jgi:hypothetical protein